MLGKYVRVRVVKPIGSTDEKTGYNYPLNYGTVYNTENQGAFIMGIHHPVSNFDGRVIKLNAFMKAAAELLFSEISKAK